MNVLLALCGLVLILAPAALGRIEGELTARAIVRLARVATAIGLMVLLVSLSTTLAPTVLHATGRPRLAMLCQSVFEHLVFGGPIAAPVTGLAGSIIVFRMIRSLQTTMRERRVTYVEEGIGAHVQTTECSVVVLESDASIAYVAAGRPPQLVLTEGILERLSADERRAVIAHEVAHIRGRHSVDLAWISAIEAGLGWLPGINAGLETWREALERAADDSAVHVGIRTSAVDAAVRRVAGARWAEVPGVADDRRVRSRLEYLRRRRRVLPAWIAAAAWSSVATFAGVGLLVVTLWATHAHGTLMAITYCPL